MTSHDPSHDPAPTVPQPVLTREIESLGGKVVSKVSKTTTICISDQGKTTTVYNSVHV